MDFVKAFGLDDLPVVKNFDGENYQVGHLSFERSVDTPDYIRELVRAAVAYYRAIAKPSVLEKLDYTIEYVGESVENDWKHNLWEVSLSYEYVPGLNHTIRVPYRTGLGIKGGPTIDHVLFALNADFNLLDGLAEETFEQWCLEYGFDNDSIRALESFEKIRDMRSSVKFLFVHDYELFREEWQEKW